LSKHASYFLTIFQILPIILCFTKVRLFGYRTVALYNKRFSSVLVGLQFVSMSVHTKILQIAAAAVFSERMAWKKLQEGFAPSRT